jgi:predicted enzyme related to lactoylglutathione lyase
MMTPQGPPGTPPNWLPYIAVKDVDASTHAAQGDGATVCMPPLAVPKVGTFSVVQDPTGAAFALFRSADA